MRLLLALAFAGSLSLVAGSSSKAWTQSPPGSTVPVPVPFELRSGFLIVVHGQIGPLDGLKFIIDTGATRSVIDEKLARTLRRQQFEGAKTQSFDTTLRARMSEVSDVRIGPLAIQSLPVLVMRLADVSSYAQDIDGLIGLDVLSHSAAFTVDYQAKTILFDLAEHTGYRPGDIGCLLMQLNVQGSPVDLVVDTGLPGIVLYRHKLLARLPGLRVRKGVQPVRMGRLHLTSARLEDVRLNGAAVDREVYFLDEAPNWAIPEIDGGIGPVALNASTLEFDLAGRQLRIH